MKTYFPKDFHFFTLVLYFSFQMGVSALAYEECGSVNLDVNSSDVRCCKKCDPGYGVAKKCSNDSDTICEPCVVGFLTPNFPHSEKCTACKKCGKYETEYSACDAVHDTICKCNFNFYYSIETQSCELCTLCPIASGAAVRCGGNTNSVCEECADGTYSDVQSPMTPCRPCTLCTSRQYMLENCTKEQDTICLGKYINNLAYFFLLFPRNVCGLDAINVVIFAGGIFSENLGKTFHVGVIFTITFLFSS